MQDVLFLVPTHDADSYLTTYMAVAFALKIIQIIHVIGVQCSVDLFFLDWEKSHTDPDSATQPTDQIAGQTQHKKQEAKVSIWRTIMLANEWNELQTVRRINPVFQLLTLSLLLQAVGLENWARFDTSVSIAMNDSRGEYSKVFRFFVGAATYILIGE